MRVIRFSAGYLGGDAKLYNSINTESYGEIPRSAIPLRELTYTLMRTWSDPRANRVEPKDRYRRSASSTSEEALRKSQNIARDTMRRQDGIEKYVVACHDSALERNIIDNLRATFV